MTGVFMGVFASRDNSCQRCLIIRYVSVYVLSGMCGWRRAGEREAHCTAVISLNSMTMTHKMEEGESNGPAVTLGQEVGIRMFPGESWNQPPLIYFTHSLTSQE